MITNLLPPTLGVYDAFVIGLLLWVGVGCLYEMKCRTFPNWIAIPALLVVLVGRLLTSTPLHWILLFMVVWGYFYWTWRAGFMGGGDARGMMILTGLWPTLPLLLMFIALWAMVAGLYILSLVIVREQGDLRRATLRLGSVYAHYRVALRGVLIQKTELFLAPGWISAVLFYWLSRGLVG